jgi:hypothetical protein
MALAQEFAYQNCVYIIIPSFLIVTQPKADDLLIVTCITLALPMLLSTVVLKSDKRDAEGELTEK